MGPAVGDLVARVISSLCNERFGIEGTASRRWLVLAEHGFEEVFNVIGGESSIGLNRGWDVGVNVFVVGGLFRVLLVNGHLIYKLFEFFVDNVGDCGHVVCSIAGAFAG